MAIFFEKIVVHFPQTEKGGGPNGTDTLGLDERLDN